jgi:LuxR family maltose regulon positive regulatory protein
VLAELSERDTDVMRAEGQYAWKRLPQEESMLRGLAAWLLGAAYFYDGETNNAETYLVQAIQLCRQSGNIFFTLISIVELSNVFREQGKYGEAYQLLLQTQREMSAGEYPTHPGLEYIYNGLSQILFARNDVAEAEQMLQRSIDLSGQGVPGEIPIFGLSTMAYVKMAQGKTGEARQLAEECLQRAEAYPLPYVPATVKAGLIRLWIMVGVPERIDAWLASCQLKPDDSIRYAHEAEYTALAKALLWQGKTQEALKVLNQLADLAIRQGRNGKLIYLLALKALALNQAGDIEQALATLETSLGMAQREGIIRPYVDEGEPIKVLLRSGSERGIWKEEALEKFVIRVLEAY